MVMFVIILLSRSYPSKNPGCILRLSSCGCSFFINICGVTYISLMKHFKRKHWKVPDSLKRSGSFLLAVLNISVVILNSIPTMHTHALLPEYSHHDTIVHHSNHVGHTVLHQRETCGHSSESCPFFQWNHTPPNSAIDRICFDLGIPSHTRIIPLGSEEVHSSQNTVCFSRAPPAV
jgi:hypothetical protein